MDKENRGGEWIQKNWQCKVDETTIQGASWKGFKGKAHKYIYIYIYIESKCGKDCGMTKNWVL